MDTDPSIYSGHRLLAPDSQAGRSSRAATTTVFWARREGHLLERVYFGPDVFVTPWHPRFSASVGFFWQSSVFFFG